MLGENVWSFTQCSKKSEISTSLYFPESSVFYETHCSTINRIEKPGSDTQRRTWQVIDLKENTSEFDTVIVTIPTPQILNLKGSIQDFLETKRSSLENVQYSSRFALALYFDRGTKINVPWTCKYVVDNPCVRFISVDSRKRFGKGKAVSGKWDFMLYETWSRLNRNLACSVFGPASQGEYCSLFEVVLKVHLNVFF